MRFIDSPMRDVDHHLANFFAKFSGFVYTFRLSPDGQGCFPFVSPGIEKLFGLKPKNVLEDMAALHALIHPEDASRIISTLESSAQALTSVHMEFRICRPDQAMRWAEFYSTPARQDDGSTLWHGVMFDVTERKRSDEVLNFIAQRGWHRDGESYLAGLTRQLGETLGVDYVIIDKLVENDAVAETMVLFAKGRVLPNMQYPLKGTPCENVMAGDLCRYPMNVQRQFPDDDMLGSMGVESYIGQPLWDSGGKVIGLVAVMDSKPIQDVPFVESMLKLASTRAAVEMERDLSEQALTESRQFLRQVINTVADPVFVKDRQHRWLMLNRAMCRFMGRPQEELLGKSDYDFFPEEEAQVFWEKDELVFTQGIENINEESFTDADGVTHTIVTSKTSFTDMHGEDILVGTIKDITTLKQIQRHLEETAGRLNSVVRSIPDLVWMKDSAGVYLSCNRAFERFFGATESEIVGKTDYDFVDKELADFFRQKDTEAMGASTIRINEEWVTLAEDGSRVLLETRKVPVYGAGSKVIGVLGIARDITERRAAEQQLSLLHSSLDHVHDTVLLVNEDARILYVNEDACHVLGFPREQLLNMRVADIDLDYPLDIWPDFWRNLKVNGTLNFESRHQSSSGRIYPVDITANYVEFDGLGYNLAICRDISERKLAQETLQRSQAALENAQRIAHIGSWDVDIVNDVLTWSDETFRIWEIDRTKFKATFSAFLDTVHPEDREKVLVAYNQAINNKSLYQVEHRLLFPDGRVKYIQERGEPYFDDDGHPVRFIGTALDITQISRQQMLETQRHRVFESIVQGGALELTLEQVAVYVNIANPDRQCGILLLNEDGSHYDVAVAPSFPEATAMSGIEISDDAGCCVAARSGKQVVVDGNKQQPCWTTCQQVCADNDVRACWTEPIVASSGQTLGIVTVYLRQPGNPEPADLEMLHQASYLCSIAIERKTLESQMHYQASYDSLTDLPNRRLFSNRLCEELARAERSGDNVVIMFIDLDYFKEVNDTLGHHYGDQLLIKVSQRIRQCVRESDIVARLGGDEFVVMMHELTEVTHLGSVAQNIIEMMTMPFHLEEHVTYTSASIGIASYPVDASNSTALMSAADQAMYTAKSKGRNCFSFFTPSMQQQAQQRLLLGNELREAIGKEQLQIFLQPIVDITSGRVIKAEALLRWKHPQHGMVPPDKFIPIAEDMGLIHEIGDWVFHQAVLAMQRWQAVRADDSEGCQISINVSARQFARDDIGVSWIERLNLLGIPMRNFVIEITESLLLGDKADVRDKLQRFRDVGMSIALDDFGTGYSSMAYLKKFNIDFLKIDRSFVHDLEVDPNDRAIAEAIVVMAHKLGLKTIAEGVETEQQKAMLAEVGCDYVQGYFYAKPMSVDAFMDYVKKQHLIEPA